MASDVIWLPIAGTSAPYEVSSVGEVRSLSRVIERTSQGKTFNQRMPGKTLRLQKNPNGYLYVPLYYNKLRPKLCTVHRLVAETFLGPFPGMHVNHKDGDKLNNRFDNLEWVTQKDNNRHSVHVLGNSRGVSNGHAKLEESDVREIRTLIQGGLTDAEIASNFPVSRGLIYHIRVGNAWKHLM